MCMIVVWRHIMDLCVCTALGWVLLSVVLSPTQCTQTPQVQNMPPNTYHAHNKHTWTITCNFNQVQVITPRWWILCDPKHVGVIFNVCLLDFYTTQILTFTTVLIECISWLIKVTITKYVYDLKDQHNVLQQLILDIYIYPKQYTTKTRLNNWSGYNIWYKTQKQVKPVNYIKVKL